MNFNQCLAMAAIAWAAGRSNGPSQCPLCRPKRSVAAWYIGALRREAPATLLFRGSYQADVMSVAPRFRPLLHVRYVRCKISS